MTVSIKIVSLKLKPSLAIFSKHRFLLVFGYTSMPVKVAVRTESLNYHLSKQSMTKENN